MTQQNYKTPHTQLLKITVFKNHSNPIHSASGILHTLIPPPPSKVKYAPFLTMGLAFLRFSPLIQPQAKQTLQSTMPWMFFIAMQTRKICSILCRSHQKTVAKSGIHLTTKAVSLDIKAKLFLRIKRQQLIRKLGEQSKFISKF